MIHSMIYEWLESEGVYDMTGEGVRKARSEER